MRGLVAIACAVAASVNALAPNVLLILVDDLRPEAEPYFAPSHPMYAQNATPSLTAFAKQAMTFTQAFVSYPNCNPSRNSFLTGIRPGRLGLYNKGVLRYLPVFPQTMPLPTVFRALGYIAYGVGKVFHHELPWLYNDFTVEQTQNSPLCTTSFTCIEPESDLTDSWSSSVAIDYLTTHSQRTVPAPFLLTVGFHRPHDAFSCPSWAFNDVNENAFTAQFTNTSSPWFSNGLPGSVTPDAANGIPASMLLDSSRVTNSPPLANLLKFRQGYASNVMWVDYCIGRVLDTLQQLNFASSTIVVIMADHGVHLGEHGAFGKSTAFEESARVPLFISVPGLPHTHGARTPAMFESIDLIPTLVDLVTGTAPENRPTPHGKLALDGRSAAQVLRGNITTMCGDKCFALTEETRCTSKTPWYIKAGAPLIACEIFDNYPANFAPVLVYSLRTPSYRYVEIRASTSVYPLSPTPKHYRGPATVWSSNGLIGRALFNHSLDDGHITIDFSHFERTNLAPCSSCTQRAPSAPNPPVPTVNAIILPSLPADDGGSFTPPQLDALPLATQLLVTQLSQVVRAIARDRFAPCSWHGLPLPVGSASPCACFHGWSGDSCETSALYPPKPTSTPTTSAPTLPAGLSPTCSPTGTPGVCASYIVPCQLASFAQATASCEALGATLCKAAQVRTSAVVPPCAAGSPLWTTAPACKLLPSALQANGRLTILSQNGKVSHPCLDASALAGVVCCVSE